MADRPVNYSQAVSFPDPADRVWDILLRFDDPRIYGEITADVVPTEGPGYKGTVNVNGAELRLSAKPYDIKMISEDLRIGIRVKPAGQICTVLAACSCSDSAPFMMDQSDLNDMLSGLDRILREKYPILSEEAEEDALPTAEEQTESEEPVPADEQLPAEALPASEDAGITESAPPAEENAPSEAEPPAEVLPDETPSPAEEPQSEPKSTTVEVEETLPVLPVSSRKKKRSRSSSGKHYSDKAGSRKESKPVKASGKKKWTAAAALLFLILAAAALVFIIKGLGKQSTGPGGHSGSGKVSIASALSAKPGDSKSEIEELLGRSSSEEGDTALYYSSDMTEYGTPSVAVQVVYEDGKASRVTVLDLERASAVGEVTGSSLSEASSPDDLDRLAGTSPSMVRSFALNGETVTEYHYGYLDPHMNFSPYWKGQLWAASVSGGITEFGTGYAYDGTDPLFHSEMTGPLLAQYSSFDDYLSDFLGLQFCLGMRSQPGRDEALKAIPSLSESGNADETTLYRGSSDEVTDDGSPVWAYTMGFGKRGDFVLFSAVNRRLWQKEGMLGASALSSIRSGMPFTEAMRCMRVLPSMVYIDYSYITLGFGRYLQDSDVLTEQFEFCLRFTLTDDILESVYDNTGTHLDLD